MVIFKCKMCGGDLHVDQKLTMATCPYCESTMTLPGDMDERKANLFNQANHYRMRGDFDRALAAYERILEDYGDDAEARWGVALNRYGIEYVQDPKTGERKPTCHRMQDISILRDPDYLEAIELAEPAARLLYEVEAGRIDAIHQEILAISRSEKPFDVFLCYKETDATGNRTQDSVLAQDIYDALESKGLRVFFARITLEDKLGTAYEPYIYAALTSSKVMIVVATSLENVSSVWVKNEWSRFLSMVKKDSTRALIPVYKDMDAYELPEALAGLQAQNASKLGFLQDLVRGVEKLVRKTAAQPSGSLPSAAQTAEFNSSLERLLDNAEAYMSMGNFDAAVGTYTKVTQEYPRDPRGWWGMIRSYTRDFTALGHLDKTETWYGYMLRMSDNKADPEQLNTYDDYKARTDKKARVEKLDAERKTNQHSINEKEVTLGLLRSQLASAQSERQREETITRGCERIRSRKTAIAVIMAILNLIVFLAMSQQVQWLFAFLITIPLLVRSISAYRLSCSDLIKAEKALSERQFQVSSKNSEIMEIESFLSRLRNQNADYETQIRELKGACGKDSDKDTIDSDQSDNVNRGASPFTCQVCGYKGNVDRSWGVALCPLCKSPAKIVEDLLNARRPTLPI